MTRIAHPVAKCALLDEVRHHVSWLNQQLPGLIAVRLAPRHPPSPQPH